MFASIKSTMKKEYSLFLVLILLVSLVNAQTLNKTNISEIGSISDVQKKTNSVLEKDLELPTWAQLIAKNIFGVKEKISLSKFIILLSIWAMLLILILNIVKIMPFFRSSGVRWVAAVAITILIALSGVVNELSSIFLLYFGGWGFLKNWSAGALFFSVFAVLFIFFVLIKLTNKLNEKLELGEIESKSQEAGFGMRMLRVVGNVFRRK